MISQRWTGRAIALAAALLGAWYGYRFGAQVSGVLFGMLMAANGALMCTILASGLWDWLLRRLGRARPSD